MILQEIVISATEVKKMKSEFSANEILDIIRAFFAAVLNVLKALGINFGDKTEDEETTAEAE